MSDKRNDIPIWTGLDGELVSHFRLSEFERHDGFVMIHPSVLTGLELVRRRLCDVTGAPVAVIVTDGVRTQLDLDRLADKYGWIDQGGTVSRDSLHLAKHGGVAVDVVAVRQKDSVRVSQDIVGKACREFFDWVKDDYMDGHVHADNRYGRRKTRSG